jgi:urease accessory protein
MQLLHQALVNPPTDLPCVRIPVDRLTLSKRRWRGVAEDGAEFGFALEHPLRDGDAVVATDAALYIVAQKYEPVLEVGFTSDAPAAAKLGWLIGNLHFPLEIAESVVRVEDDSALRQLFEREQIPFVACKRVFHPLSGGHRH